MVSILIEDTGPESHRFAATDPLSAIFRHRTGSRSDVTTTQRVNFLPGFSLSGSARKQDQTEEMGVELLVSNALANLVPHTTNL